MHAICNYIFKFVYYNFTFLKYTISDLHLQPNSTKNVTEGEDLVVTCNTEGEPSRITYNKWVHSGEFVTRDYPGGATWRINQASYKDTGIYQCEATNTIYTKMAYTEVVVFCKSFHIHKSIYK